MFNFLPHASPVIGTNKHQRVAVEKLTSLGLSVPENNSGIGSKVDCDSRVLEFGLPYVFNGKAMGELLKYRLLKEHNCSKIKSSVFYTSVKVTFVIKLTG